MSHAHKDKGEGEERGGQQLPLHGAFPMCQFLC